MYIKLNKLSVYLLNQKCIDSIIGQNNWIFSIQKDDTQKLLVLI